MKDRIRVAITGTGKAGQMHAQALKNIQDAEFAAVHSRTMAKAEAFSRQYDVKPYSDVQTMIKKERINVLIVCTPHPDHKHATIAGLQSGANVLVEKPLASSLEDCDAMIDTAHRHKKKLGVVSQRRFFPPSQRIKKAIEEGKIGKPVLGLILLLGWRDESYYKGDAWRGTWDAEGGGVLVNQAPHQLDLLQWYMGGDIEELYGQWQNVNHPYIEVEDTAVAIVKFRNGGMGNIVVSNSQKPGLFGKVHIHGSNGASVGVQTDGGAMFIAGVSTINEPAKNDIWTVPGEEQLPAQWEQEETLLFKRIDPIEYYIRLQDQDFIMAVQNDTDPLVPGKEGRKTVEIFTAIYRSTKMNQPIRWPL